MLIRQATLLDVESLSSVNFRSWKTTYEGLIEGGMPIPLNEDGMRMKWTNSITISNQSQEKFVFVAEVDDQIVGYSVCGKNRKDEITNFDWELYAIYLLKEYQGKGLGTQLFSHSVNEMKQRGARSFILFVLATNLPSVRFYESFCPDFRIDNTVTIAEKEYPHTGFGWSDIDSFQCN